MDLRSQLDARKEKVEEYLENIFDPIIQANLRRAMEHLPNAGGKRLRPICAMLACELAGTKTITASMERAIIAHGGTMVQVMRARS